VTRLGRWNDVGWTGGRWRYGLKTRNEIGSLAFSVVRVADGAELHLSGLSPYRTTSLSRRMGDGRLGYETEARRAIREFEAAP
jgi:hypothetical protein